jgi:hypothetical protein
MLANGQPRPVAHHALARRSRRCRLARSMPPRHVPAYCARLWIPTLLLRLQLLIFNVSHGFHDIGRENDEMNLVLFPIAELWCVGRLRRRELARFLTLQYHPLLQRDSV